ncbi:hypothetical protein AAVH_26682 [Aphelenchoides avenae]|nr:hypothetical protein AAVH_26682 [Aphelenchus avenae]
MYVPTTSRVGAPELRNRIGTWWLNPRMADKFNVGPPDGFEPLDSFPHGILCKKSPAHILVVAPASEVFNAMFLGSFDVPPTIDVLDGDPDAFKEMLRFRAWENFSIEFETDQCVFFSGVTCSFRSRKVEFTLSVDGRTLDTSPPLGCDYLCSFAFDLRGQVSYGSAALELDSPVLVQAHRKYKVSVTAYDAVGTQTRRVTQIIGRQWKNSDRTLAELLQGERHVLYDSEPVHFTLTYGETRCVFAELLYRYVDDLWCLNMVNDV